MSQRRLPLDDDDVKPRPRRRQESVEEVLAMLEKMATLMHYRTDRGLKWYARAVGGSEHGFSEANTAIEAMRGALGLD